MEKGKRMIEVSESDMEFIKKYFREQRKLTKKKVFQKRNPQIKVLDQWIIEFLKKYQ